MADSTKSKRENAVLLHHPDAVDTDREALMGRHAAGEGFFKGFVRHSGVDAFYCQCLEDGHAEDFAQRASAFGALDRECINVPVGQMGQSPEAPKTLMIPQPGMSMYAWRRRISAHARSYSLCGLNHTIASDTVMEDIGQLLTSPVQSWDALICTSQAVKSTLQRLLDNWADYLGRRSGGRFKPEVQMPIIPLGVDTARYAATPQAEEARMAIRRGLGIGDDDIAVLYFGRMSFHAKAHPLPMYLGLEEAAKRTGKRIHLLQAGRFANDGVEQEFREGARRYCPGVNAIFLDGRDQGVSERVWFAADIFTSLSDNIQESFGLTPIEAMAAGLPVVASNWDGYRDTVRHGTDGILIPTWLPLPDSGSDLSLQIEGSLTEEMRSRSYNQYSGVVSQATAVDVGAAADAYSALAVDPALRRRLGEAGRKRARETYDWQVVINAYQDLWRELANIRSRSVESGAPVQGRPAHPLRDDPFALFQSYPSGTINGDAVVTLTSPGRDGLPVDFKVRLAEMRASTMNDYAQSAMLSDEDIHRVAGVLSDKGACSVIALAEPLDEGVRFRLPRTLAWLAKLGLVALSEPTASAKTAFSGPAPAKTEAQSLVDLGLAARSRGAIEAGAEYFEKALRTDPDHVEANFQFGELLAAVQKLPDAARCLQRAVDQDRTHLAARRSLGKVLFLLGDERAALEMLEDAVALDADDVESRYLLGAGYRRAGAANKAIPHLQAALKLSPQRSDALTHIALARKSLGRASEARIAIDQALEIDPSNVFARAAYLSLRTETRGRKNLSHLKTAKRVGIHINRRFHFPLLRGLFDALSEEHWPLITGDGRELIEFDPDVVIVCDGQAEVLRASIPKATYIQTRNSMAVKNYFTRIPKPGDYICVSSEAVKKQFMDMGGLKQERLWVTGYVGNDALFKKQGRSLPFDLPIDKKVVLYAPTFTPSMTSAAMLGENLVSLIRGERTDICILIKPHPNFCEQPSDIRSSWQKLSATDPDVYLMDDPEADISAAMQASDMMISDASGVVFQYLTLDRPIVLLSNPNKSKDVVFFDADGPEWAWRDVGHELSDVSQLAAAVDEALDNPLQHQDKRRQYRDILFGDLRDGDAAERIVRKINEVNS